MKRLVPFRDRGRRTAAIARLALATFAAVALAAGCTHHGYHDPAAMVDQSAAGRLLGVDPGDRPALGPGGRTDLGSRVRLGYPLAVGNRWEYAIHARSVIVTPTGPLPPDVQDELWQAAITGTVHLGEHDYFLQQESNPEVVGPILASTFRMRQDRDGLFELDSPELGSTVGRAEMEVDAPLAAELSAYVGHALADPSQRAAFQRAAVQLASRVGWLTRNARLGSAEPEEIALLRYPLFPGASWIVRDSPRFERTVVAREHLVLPAGTFHAWRIRGTSELFDPTDRVAFWYASAGLVRIRVHAEANATDDTGNVIGHVLFDSDQQLTQVHLVDPGAPHPFALAPADPAGDE